MLRHTKSFLLVASDAVFLTASFIGACYLVRYPARWLEPSWIGLFAVIIFVQLLVFFEVRPLSRGFEIREH